MTFFLHTDDFWRDYHAMAARGVEFVRPPLEAPYGTVAVFRDLYGNLWDRVEPAGARAPHAPTVADADHSGGTGEGSGVR